MKLKRYCELNRGAQARIARQLGVPSQLVWQWQDERRPVPENRCPLIELATAGEVTCEELRSDIAWVRVADSRWPNALGRPTIDVVGPAWVLAAA